MRNFKLKYFIYFFLVALQWSCSVEESVKEADGAATQNSKTFIFEKDINHYIINGKIVSDRAEITNAAENAWNIHFDYSHNKVVISTTPDEFEKYKNSDLQFKRGFESRLVEEETTNSNSIGNHNTVANRNEYTDYYVDNVNEKATLWLSYSSFISSGLTHFCSFGFLNSDTDLSTMSLNINKTNDAISAEANQISAYKSTINVSNLIANDNAGQNMNIAIANDKDSSVKCTFYAETSYQGSSITITVPKKTARLMPNVELMDPESFKRNQ